MIRPRPDHQPKQLEKEIKMESKVRGWEIELGSWRTVSRDSGEWKGSEGVPEVRNWWYLSILVIYGCVTNYPKT